MKKIKQKFVENKEKIIKGVLGALGIVTGVILIKNLASKDEPIESIELVDETTDISEEAVSTEEE